jgi:hypothetical protein
MHEMDVVAGGVMPDKSRVMRLEVVEDDDKPFIGICFFIRSQHLPDVLLFRALLERDDGGAVDGENGEGVGPDLRSVLHEWRVVKRPHPLGIGSCLRRTLIQEPEHRMLAHPREFFENRLCIRRSAVIPRVGFPKVHAGRFQDPPDRIQAVGDAEGALLCRGL